MPWRGPNYEGEFPTLGWELLELYSQYLVVPSGDATGSPFQLTDEQALFMLRWYAVGPTTGRFTYRRACLRRSKGWGKSPFAAAWLFGEFVGPVVFDGWNAEGEPVGRPWTTPWLQVAAVSEDQTDNTFVALYEMLSSSPAIDEFDIDLGQTRIVRTGRPGTRIEPVTAAAGSREGQPITGAVLDQSETWYRTNGGVRLAATLRRNAAKMGGRTLETPNAHAPGEGSVAEKTFEAFEKGTAGLLYDSREAPPVNDLTSKRELRRALKLAYGDSTWIDLDRLVADIQDPATDPADARRWWLNQVVKASGRAIDPVQWNSLAVGDGPPADGTEIGIGFDGSISDDSTVLYGCTRDGFGFLIRAWERPAGAPRDWRVPRLEVHEAVHSAFERWRVGRMNCDPAKWWSELDEWALLYGEKIVVAVDTNSSRRFAPVCDRFATAVRERTFTHDGNGLVNRHVANMARKQVISSAEAEDGRTKYVFVKADTGKIDAGIAAALALEAAMTMPALEPAVADFFTI